MLTEIFENTPHCSFIKKIAPTNTSLKTTEFVTNSNMVIFPHPPYSPGLARSNFAFFPKLKMKQKRRRFETVTDIQRELQAVLSSIMGKDFHDTFEGITKTMGSLYTIPSTLF
jgi:hypothetical protein